MGFGRRRERGDEAGFDSREFGLVGNEGIKLLVAEQLRRKGREQSFELRIHRDELGLVGGRQVGAVAHHLVIAALDDADLLRVEPARIALVIYRLVTREKIRSEEPTSELKSLMRNSYVVFCWTTKNVNTTDF